MLYNNKGGYYMKKIIAILLTGMLMSGHCYAENVINKNLECPRCNSYTYTENYNTNYTKHYFGICSTCHYESSDESMINNDDNITAIKSDDNNTEYVYWTRYGHSYHSSTSCHTLRNSKKIYKGTIEECPNSDPCDFCYSYSNSNSRLANFDQINK